MTENVDPEQPQHALEESSSPAAPEVAPDSPLTEDLALSLLKNVEVPALEIEHLAKNVALMKSRKIRVALAAHAHTPRHLALRVIRELYTFDLMQFALRPTAPADLKRTADEILVNRLPSITLGERISLARRCSALLGTALLVDREPRVWQAALENPRLTEAAVIKALHRSIATPAFVQATCHHAKWSVRPDIRIALLRNAHTPLPRALDFARALAASQLREILRNSRLPEKIKALLRKDAEARKARVEPAGRN